MLHAVNKAAKPPRLELAGETYGVTGVDAGLNGAASQRFAKEIAVWLDREVEERRIERVIVFASAQFLGTLREAWSPRTAMLITEWEGDLSSVAPEDLVRIPAVSALLRP